MINQTGFAFSALYVFILTNYEMRFQCVISAKPLPRDMYLGERHLILMELPVLAFPPSLTIKSGKTLTSLLTFEWGALQQIILQ